MRILTKLARTGLVLGCIEAKFCKIICVGIRIYLKALTEIYTMHSFAQLLESIIENWGKKEPGQNNPEKVKKFTKAKLNFC